MAISHIGSNGYFGPSASPTVSPVTPVGTTLDDLLILQIISIQNAVIAAPSGWTTLRADAGSGISPAVYYRWATASEPTTQSITFASSRYTVMLSSYRGVDKTTPFDGVAVALATGTTTIAAYSSITPASAGAWIVASRMESHASGVATATYTSSNMTVRATSASNLASAVNTDVSVADFAWTSGAFTPNLTNTATMSQNRGYVFALRPAAAASTPKSGTDTAAGTDAASLATDLPTSDAAIGADASSLAASLTASGVGGVATDAASLAASLTSSDTATATDAASVVQGPVSVLAGDTATSTDAASLAATSSAGDAASAVDAASVSRTPTVTDTATATDAATVTTSPAVADSATAVDAATVAVALSSADAATATDAATVSTGAAVSAGDTATATDSASVSRTSSAADSATATDAASVSITAAGTLFSDNFNRTPGVVATSSSYTQGTQGNGLYGTDETTGWNATQNPGGLWRTDSADLTLVDDGAGNGLLTGDPTGWSGVTGWYRAHLSPNLVQIAQTTDSVTYSFRYKQSAFGLTNPSGIVGGDATDLWVAYQSQYTLLAIQFARQDNRIICKRKVPTPGQSGNNYGTYYNLKHTTDSPLAGNYVGSTATYANLPTATKNAIAAAEGRAWSDTLATDGTNTAGTWYDFSVKCTLVGTDGMKIQLFRAGVLIGSWYDAFGITTDNYHCPLHGTFIGEYETHHTTANGHNDPPQNWMRRPLGNRTGSAGFRSDNVQPWIDNFTIVGAAVPSTPVSTGDTATATESASVARSSSAGDTAGALDAAVLVAAQTGAESASAADSATLAANSSSSDSATATDAAALATAPTASDSATATDSASASPALLAADTATAIDAASTSATLAAADSAAASESASVGSGGLLFSDDFNRADSENLGSNWTQSSAVNFRNGVVSNQLGASKNGGNLRWNTPTTGSQFSQVTYKGLDDFGPMVGMTAFTAGAGFTGVTGQDGIEFHKGGTSVWLTRYTNGAGFSLGSIAATVNVGDVLRLEWDGTNVRGYINGALVITRTSSTNAIATHQYVGLWSPTTASSSTILGDDWSGGDLVATGTPISGSDSAAGTDAATVARTSTATDSATGVDAASSSASVAAADTATATDAATVLTGAAVSASDSAVATDAASVARSSTVADTATAVDAAAASATVTAGDSATATDAATVLTGSAVTAGDTATATDAATVARSSTAADTATATDAATVNAGNSFSVGDTASATDAATVSRASTVGDTGAAAEAASKSSTSVIGDVGSATDSAAVRTDLTAADSAAATEAASRSASVVAGDSATATEGASVVVLIVAGDNASASELASLAVSVAASDLATAVESGTVSLLTDFVPALEPGASVRVNGSAAGVRLNLARSSVVRNQATSSVQRNMVGAGVEPNMIGASA